MTPEEERRLDKLETDTTWAGCVATLLCYAVMILLALHADDLRKMLGALKEFVRLAWVP